jgi:hypothetical protein
VNTDYYGTDHKKYGIHASLYRTVCACTDRQDSDRQGTHRTSRGQSLGGWAKPRCV